MRTSPRIDHVGQGLSGVRILCAMEVIPAVSCNRPRCGLPLALAGGFSTVPSAAAAATATVVAMGTAAAPSARAAVCRAAARHHHPALARSGGRDNLLYLSSDFSPALPARAASLRAIWREHDRFDELPAGCCVHTKDPRSLVTTDEPSACAEISIGGLLWCPRQVLRPRRVRTAPDPPQRLEFAHETQPASSLPGEAVLVERDLKGLECRQQAPPNTARFRPQRRPKGGRENP